MNAAKKRTVDESNEVVASIVCWSNRTCQTRNAKWLFIDQLYEKLHRPNFYNIGSTYLNDVLEYTFTAKVENVGPLFILHIFIMTRHEGAFVISINEGSDLTFDQKNRNVYLSSISKEHRYDIVPIQPPKEGTPHYITTYSFSEFDVDLLKDKKLYIAFSYAENKCLKQEIIDNVKFCHDFGAILSESVRCDFRIISAEGNIFYVHKAILCVHSSVFKAMLKEDTAESLKNEVELKDIGKEDLCSMLEFIYTGTIKDLESANWYNLLMITDKYDLKGLAELTQHTIAQQLATDNVINILVASDMYNTRELKAACLKFIKKNYSVVKDSFAEIKDVKLMRELTAYLAPLQ